MTMDAWAQSKHKPRRSDAPASKFDIRYAGTGRHNRGTNWALVGIADALQCSVIQDPWLPPCLNNITCLFHDRPHQLFGTQGRHWHTAAVSWVRDNQQRSKDLVGRCFTKSDTVFCSQGNAPFDDLRIRWHDHSHHQGARQRD